MRIPGTALLLALSIAAGDTLAADTFIQPRDERGRFLNLDGNPIRGGIGDLLKWRFGERTKAPARAPVPTVAPDLARIATPPRRGEGARVTWIGHASWLVQLDGKSFLVDPILGNVWPGLHERNAPPGLTLEQLPPIDAVLVSHDHYDHLDVATLTALAAREGGGVERPIHVVGGLGMRKLLGKRHGLFVTELGWWEATRFGDVTITFVPAQHFARRTLGDMNERLWGGWVIQGSSATVYHAGDTAWFPGFAEIGRRFPAIDAALLPIGAYDPAWFMERVHLNPEQALRAFRDLGAHTFFAMHWGTFKLADEPLDEPPRRLEAERVRVGLARERVRVPAIGETIDIEPAAAQR